MRLHRPVAEAKQQVRDKKLDRLAQRIANTIRNHGDGPDIGSFMRFDIGEPPLSCEYTYGNKVGQRVAALLREMSLSWDYNHQTSFEASTQLGSVGYGNHNLRSLKPEGHTLIFDRILAEPAKVYSFELPESVPAISPVEQREPWAA